MAAWSFPKPFSCNTVEKDLSFIHESLSICLILVVLNTASHFFSYIRVSFYCVLANCRLEYGVKQDTAIPSECVLALMYLGSVFLNPTISTSTEI